MNPPSPEDVKQLHDFLHALLTVPMTAQGNHDITIMCEMAGWFSGCPACTKNVKRNLEHMRKRADAVGIKIVRVEPGGRA